MNNYTKHKKTLKTDKFDFDQPDKLSIRTMTNNKIMSKNDQGQQIRLTNKNIGVKHNGK